MIHELLFEHTVPQQIILGGVIAAAIIALLTFWRYLPRDRSVLLMAGMRLLFFLVLAWCLFRPMDKRRQSEQLKPRFLVVTDTSASMALAPQKAIPTRWSVVQEVLKQPWAQEIPLKAEMDCYTFDSVLGSKMTVKQLAGLEAKGQGTRLRDSLQQVCDRYRGQPLAGILLLSDGLDTRELTDDWASASWPAPIFSVRLEPPNSWEETPDVRVMRVDTPRRVVAGWQSELTAVIGANGTKGEPINVQLYENDKLLQEMPTQIPAGGGTRELKFQLDHKAIGSYVYKVRVPPIPREVNIDDNEFSITVDVTDTKNRVLYVEGVPRFDFKFLKRALEKNKEISPIVLLQGPDGSLMSMGHAGTVNLTMAHEQLAQFKIVVLGNLDAHTLGDERAKALVKFVDEGGSLILLGGDDAWSARGFAGSPLKDLVPVQMGSGEATEGKLNVILTTEGKTHPALQAVAQKWAKPMPVLSIYPTTDSSKGARVVMTADDKPLVVTQPYGQGKVAAILSNSLWRWQLEPGQKEEYQTFWDGMIQWLMPQASKVDAFNLDLSADIEQMFLGETIVLSARIGGAQASKAGSVPVSVQIQTPDGRKIPFPMPQAASGAGKGPAVFNAEYKADVGGMHNAVATATIDGRPVQSGPFSFFVKPFTPETSPRGQNEAVLKALAQASGGQFLEKERVNEVLMGLNIRTSEEERVIYQSLWDSPFILGGLILLLALDWIMRKRKNMA